MACNVINRTHPDILRKAGQHGSDLGLLYIPPGFNHVTIGVTGLADRYTARSGMNIRRFELNNRAAAANVGIGFRFDRTCWQAGLLTANDATYTSFAGSEKTRVTPVTLGVTGADQTGFAILCSEPFSWASFDCTTAETNAGGSTVVDHAVQYSNGSGATWATVSADSILTDSFTTTNAVWGTGAHNFVWHPPSDWAKTKGLGGLSDGYYALAVRAAEREASDVAAIATGIEIGTLLSIEALAQYGVWEVEEADFYSPYADGVVAYFSIADAGNRVYAEVETK